MVGIELLGLAGRRIVDAALIDTGADASAFPIHWMRRLGIRKMDCKQHLFITAGGEAKQWQYPKTLTGVVLGKTIELEGVFVDTPVALLGRNDFMTHFELTFDHHGSRVLARPYR
jgi:predicted aspartyl protease